MLKFPHPLCPGDTVAIISPASVVDPSYIDGAVSLLEAEGFRVRVMPNAKGPASGSYAAPASARLADILDALRDPDIRAILCARGGYGSMALLPRIPLDLIRRDPKWLIGFSDITALHSLWNSAGVISLHAPMAKHLTEEGPDDPCTRRLVSILKGDLSVVDCMISGPDHSASLTLVRGEESPVITSGSMMGEGRLTGGNLAVFNNLAATPWDPLAGDDPVILFIEDISEAIYAVERMLRRILMTPVCGRLRGLVVGHFTDYRHPDRNFPDMETMIASLLEELGLDGRFPVLYHFPAGHTSSNTPLLLGSRMRLTCPDFPDPS